MAQIIPLQPRGSVLGVRFLFLFAGLGILIGLSFAVYWGQFTAKNPKRPVTIDPVQIQVIDGDTVRANGHVYRLVGYDAPESGLEARCESERTLAAHATSRLRQIVAAGRLQAFRRD
jgi:endonuclease YncB( thermonuclease family)